MMRSHYLHVLRESRVCLLSIVAFASQVVAFLKRNASVVKDILCKNLIAKSFKMTADTDGSMIAVSCVEADEAVMRSSVKL